MKTRKQLIAENTQLRAQIDVSKHVTRKMLNNRVAELEKRVIHLDNANKALEGALAKEREKVKELTAPKEEA